MLRLTFRHAPGKPMPQTSAALLLPLKGNMVIVLYLVQLFI